MRATTSADSAPDLPGGRRSAQVSRGARRARVIASEVLAEVKDAVSLPPSPA